MWHHRLVIVWDSCLIWPWTGSDGDANSEASSGSNFNTNTTTLTPDETATVVNAQIIHGPWIGQAERLEISVEKVEVVNRIGIQ